MLYFAYYVLYFKKDKNATEMQKKVCALYREGVVTDPTCQKWFAKFRTRDFLLDDASWQGRPGETDNDQLETLRTSNTIPHGRQPAHPK